MNLFHSLCGGKRGVNTRKPALPRTRLNLESLEDRSLMSTSGLSVVSTAPLWSEGFRGGVSVAVGDVNGDGLSDIVIGAGAGAHVKAFEIKDISFGVENPTTIGGATGGAGMGGTMFDEFTIQKTTDAASPVFFKNCCAGAHYGTLTIDTRMTGGDSADAGKPFLRFKFDTVFTTKIDWSGPGDEGPEESITFIYGKLGVKYLPAFEIKDFSFGVENPTTIGAATGGAGAGKFNEFTIIKTSDTASPEFFKNCCAGAHYKTVTIDMRKSGGDSADAGQPFLRFKFDTVFTTKIDWSGPGDEGPEESITFIFGKLPVASNEQIRQAIFNFYSDNPKGDEMVHQSVALSNEPADAVDNDDAEMVVCDLGPQSPDQVDSFFDITYRIDLDASAGSGIAVSKLEAPALNHDTGGPLLETQPELLISPGVSMDKFGDEIEVPGGESGAALPRIGWEVIVSYQDSEPADPVYWPIGPLPE